MILFDGGTFRSASTRAFLFHFWGSLGEFFGIKVSAISGTDGVQLAASFLGQGLLVVHASMGSGADKVSGVGQKKKKKDFVGSLWPDFGTHTFNSLLVLLLLIRDQISVSSKA